MEFDSKYSRLKQGSKHSAFLQQATITYRNEKVCPSNKKNNKL